MKVKKTARNILIMIIFLSICFAVGIGLGVALAYLRDGDFSLKGIIVMLLLALAAYFLNIVLHEAGHLLMGLLTGYRFLSFRIFSWILIRDENGRYHMNSFNIPGTVGQCLLIPPELDENGHMPYVLYNLGGIMVNFIIASVSAAIFFLTPISGTSRIFIALLGFVGLFIGIENAIPLGALGINNDGANMVSLSKSPRVVKALWKQLMINAYQTQGYLFQQMPEEFFEMPTIEEMSDRLISAEAVFIENRDMETMDHEKTLDTLDFLLDTAGIDMIDIYRVTLESDRILVRLLLGMPVTVEKSFKKSLRQFSVLPNVLVTRYAVARLVDGDLKESQKLRKQFDAVIRKYPFRCDRLTLPRYMNEIDKRVNQ